MKKRTVISNTPIKLPLQSTILYTFLLWHFEVHPIWWGVFITLYGIYWIIVIVIKFNEILIDLDKDEPKSKAVKSKFSQRLEKLVEEKKYKVCPSCLGEGYKNGGGHSDETCIICDGKGRILKNRL